MELGLMPDCVIDWGYDAFERLYRFIVDNDEYFSNRFGHKMSEWNHTEWASAAEASFWTMNNLMMYEDVDDGVKLESSDIFDIIAAFAATDNNEPAYYMLEKSDGIWQYLGRTLMVHNTKH